MKTSKLPINIPKKSINIRKYIIVENIKPHGTPQLLLKFGKKYKVLTIQESIKFDKMLAIWLDQWDKSSKLRSCYKNVESYKTKQILNTFAKDFL